MQWVECVFFFSMLLHAVQKQDFRKHLQNHQIGKIGESSVRDVGDLVKGEGHGLQGREGTQGIDWYLGQSVVIQPQVAQRGQSFETVLRYS